MAPIARITALTLALATAFASASPILATPPTGYAPALVEAAAPSIPKLKAPVPLPPPATIIYSCKVKGVAALTFDDGPGERTPDLLKLLAKEKVKATFFVNGDNYGKILDSKNRKIVKDAYNAGHQIASHTWNHIDLDTLSWDKIHYQMKTLDDALIKIIGKRPVYMRPPRGATNALALSYLGQYKYKVIEWDQDTNDWRHLEANDAVAQSMAIYKKALTTSGLKKNGHIFLQHDTIATTATELASQAIALAKKKGYKLVTVGECLGQPNAKDWYRK
ncbi:hypothetical protein BGX34_001824 [Mortierella sp. NVP85]|nr:hypothetical protein BGX34_001824 [Mortierella sp. NVP85]